MVYFVIKMLPCISDHFYFNISSTVRKVFCCLLVSLFTQRSALSNTPIMNGWRVYWFGSIQNQRSRPKGYHSWLSPWLSLDSLFHSFYSVANACLCCPLHLHKFFTSTIPTIYAFFVPSTSVLKSWTVLHVLLFACLFF